VPQRRCHHRCRPQARAPDRHDHHRHGGRHDLPAAYATGEGGEFRAPMAIAVIGGLLTSTVLSLLVIPVVFTYVDDLLLLLKRLAGRLHRANHGVGVKES
jgi:hypothetical protein